MDSGQFFRVAVEHTALWRFVAQPELLLSKLLKDLTGTEARTTQSSLRESDFTEVKSMQFKFLFAAVVAFALSLGAIAQQTDSGIKQDTKDAAHSTGKAVKKTGHKIKKGTKKVVHKSAEATEKGANKVEDKTAPKPTPPPQK